MTDVSSSGGNRRLYAVGLMVCAVSCFTCLDTTAKYLINSGIPTVEVVWARYLGAFVLAIILSNPVSHPGLMRTSRPLLQVGRSALLVFSTILAFIALRYLQLDEQVSIIFSAPFMVAALSGPILGEWIGWKRWAAICTAFAGVLVVLRPFGGNGVHPIAILTFCSVFCYAIYMITTRMLARSDSNETTLFYSNMVGAVVMSAAVPFVWVTPDSWLVVGLMVLIGAFGSVGHYLLIIAHRHAPAAVLSPYIYTQLIGMSVLGYLVFGHVPSHWTVVGALIVIASGLYLLSLDRAAFKNQT